MIKFVPFLTSTTMRLVRFFFAAAFVVSLAGSLAHAADNPKVVEAMTALKAEAAKLGAPKLEGEDIVFGATKMGGNFVIVDEIKTKYGATATIFAKKGANYVRITTNVMKDGQRALGSVLDPSGPAYASINQGKPFYGLVDILGKMFDTGYEPIKTEAGEIVGILYVGFLAE
jgi:methyl-accepting chemotaxis protein